VYPAGHQRFPAGPVLRRRRPPSDAGGPPGTAGAPLGDLTARTGTS